MTKASIALLMAALLLMGAAWSDATKYTFSATSVESAPST